MSTSDTATKPSTPAPAATVEKKSAAKPKTAVKRKAAAKPKAAVSKPALKPATNAIKAKPAKSVKPVKPAAKAAAVKSGAPAKPLANTKPVVVAKEKARKSKLVRDSFTMPELEYAGLGEVKKTCLKAGIDVKKSELLRVGVALVRKMDLAALKQALAGLSPLKAGRPKKDK